MNVCRFIQIAKRPALYANAARNLNNIIISKQISTSRWLSTSHNLPCNSRPTTDAKFITANQEHEKEEKEGLLSRIVKKIPFIDFERHKLRVCAYLLYESVADTVNYVEFFDEFALPDTFYSWFVITEMHVWMLMVRCMAEGEDGRFVRNSIVQAMWTDVGVRAKKLGAHNPSGVRGQIKDLSEQFQAALIAYDEGMQGDDKVLAGALWRRVYQMKDADPEHLECLVKYMRKQIRLLDHISRKQLFSQTKINWETLDKL